MALIPWLRRDREPTVDIFAPLASGGIVPGGPAQVMATERERFSPLEPEEVAARRAFSGDLGPLLGPLPHNCTPACPKYRNPASDYTGPILQGRRGEPIWPGRAS